MKFISKTNVKYEFEVDWDDTVCLVKKKLSMKVNSTYDNIGLTFKCRILEDQSLFRQYKIPIDQFVLFYLIKEKVLRNSKGLPHIFEICQCGNYEGELCKFRPLSVNISNFSRGIIYNIRTTAGTKVGHAIKDSPFIDIRDPSDRLVYNQDYLDEERDFLFYGIQNGNVIKLTDGSPQHADDCPSDDMLSDISPWILLGLNAKSNCAITWINFLHNNYEYFTVRLHVREINVAGLEAHISRVFDIPTDRVRMFRDKHHNERISEQSDLDELLMGKIRKKFLLTGGNCNRNSDCSPSMNDKRRSGYQYSVAVYYCFVPDFDNLLIRNVIGQGSFGIIYKCTDVHSNRTFALKKFLFPYNQTPDLSAFDREIDILCALGGHPRIVTFERRILVENELHILMEFIAGGSLRAYLQLHGPMRESLIARYSGQIVEALEYLHGRKIIHRDVKGDNILLDDHHNVKLADFGLSKKLIGIGSQNLLMGATKSFVGTANYMAPEIITGKEYGSPTDIWSFGATVIEMLTGKPPYYNLEHLNVLFKIGTEGKIEFDHPENTSDVLLDFIQWCLKSNPSDRPTAGKLLEHDFLIEN